jgi:hypothetical protein
MRPIAKSGSPALSMIPGRQQSWRPWFPWGFSLAPSRKRAAFIRSAGEPEIRVSFDRQESATKQRFLPWSLSNLMRKTVYFFVWFQR